ncbi:MAG: STAS/SEC14 domain-containing protein [Gammaproteobacteria bacterium]
MAHEIVGIDGEVLHVCIRGTMRLADRDAVQSLARDLIERGIKPRLLVTTENFAGWEKAEEWGDVGFLMDYGDDILKMAIVGEERWKEQALMFAGEGLRATKIEFFPPSALTEALLWVGS